MKSLGFVSLLLGALFLYAHFAVAMDYSDLPDVSHYSYSGVIAAIENGIMAGTANGIFDCSGYITRIEAAVTVVNILGMGEKADIRDIIDLNPEAWYIRDGRLSAAVGMGIITPVGGRLWADEVITREEAFYMLAKIISIKDADISSLYAFSDWRQVSPPYAPYVSGLISGGYINGLPGDGGARHIDPKSSMTRGEFAALINRIFQHYIGENQNVSVEMNGNVVINGPGARLSGMKLNGDLLIGDGAGEARINNVKAYGQVVVRGGGEYHITGGSVINRLIVTGDGARIIIAAGSIIKHLILAGDGAVVIADGAIYHAEITGKNAVIDYPVPDEVQAVVHGQNPELTAPPTPTPPTPVPVPPTPVPPTPTPTPPTPPTPEPADPIREFADQLAEKLGTAQVNGTNVILLEHTVIDSDITVPAGVTLNLTKTLEVKNKLTIEGELTNPNGKVVNAGSVTLSGVVLEATEQGTAAHIDADSEIIGIWVIYAGDSYGVDGTVLIGIGAGLSPTGEGYITISNHQELELQIYGDAQFLGQGSEKLFEYRHLTVMPDGALAIRSILRNTINAATFEVQGIVIIDDAAALNHEDPSTLLVKGNVVVKNGGTLSALFLSLGGDGAITLEAGAWLSFVYLGFIDGDFEVITFEEQMSQDTIIVAAHTGYDDVVKYQLETEGDWFRLSLS